MVGVCFTRESRCSHIRPRINLAAGFLPAFSADLAAKPPKKQEKEALRAVLVASVPPPRPSEPMLLVRKKAAILVTEKGKARCENFRTTEN